MHIVREDLLHFIWMSGFLRNRPLQCTNGNVVKIQTFGTYNTHAGPDFLNASIRIDDTLWYGNVEFHVRSSDWYLHKHEKDPRYQNVVLHVVYHHDRPVFHSAGEEIPVLELWHHLPPVLLKRYHYLMKNKSRIPCEKIFRPLPAHQLIAWLDRLFISRLERKSAVFTQLLNDVQQHWDKAWFIQLARCFGGKVNAQPFEMMVARLPIQQLGRYRNDPESISAICLGVAGFLQRDSAFAHDTRDRYEFLKHKFNLEELDSSVWKFSRMRPGSFPDHRIRQFSRLIPAELDRLSTLLQMKRLEEIEHLFRFANGEKQELSDTFVHNLMLNAVLPVLYTWDMHQRKQGWTSQIIPYCQTLPVEDNQITRLWEKTGVPVRHSFDSQAVIELKTNYCDELKCLHCGIGHYLLLNEPSVSSVSDPASDFFYNSSDYPFHHKYPYRKNHYGSSG